MNVRKPATRGIHWRPTPGETCIVLGPAGMVVSLLIFLYVIPMPHVVTFRPATNTIGSSYEFDPPAGSFVDVTWSATHDLTLSFVVQDSLNDRVYVSWATNGSFDFTADHPPYVVWANGDFQISGTYYSPTL